MHHSDVDAHNTWVQLPKAKPVQTKRPNALLRYAALVGYCVVLCTALTYLLPTAILLVDQVITLLK